MQKQHPKPKIYEGDKYAVVAMLLRRRPKGHPASQGTRATKENEEATTKEDETARELPPPVDLLPNDRVEIVRDYNQVNDFEKIFKNVEDLEMFFILRANNAKDRWSGQVGFPGGRASLGESSEETAARECFEEIGIILPHLNAVQFQNQLRSRKPTSFELIGRCNDRMILQNNKRLVVSCLVYLQKQEVIGEEVEYFLEPKEVAAAGWCSVDYLNTPRCLKRMNMKIEGSLVAQRIPVKLINMLGISSIVFTKVDLKIDPLYKSTTNLMPEETIKKNFFLWGLTLGMVNDFLFEFSKLRTSPMVIGARWGVEPVFDSFFHNFMLQKFRNSYASVTGTQLTWSEFTRYYLLSVVCLPLISLPMGIGYYYHRSSKL